MAERVTNGGFETGDLTGWTYDKIQGIMTAPYVHSGTYAVSLFYMGATGSYIQQTVNLTDVNDLTYWHMDIDTGTFTHNVYVDSNLVHHTEVFNPDWEFVQIDVSSYSGDCVVRFESGDSDYEGVVLDDISALSAPPDIDVQINIGDSWKPMTAMKINIGDSWKDVVSVKQNIGDTWKTVF